MAQVVTVSQAYAALVKRALTTLPAALAERALSKRGTIGYTSPVNELALYIRGPYAEKLIRSGQKYVGDNLDGLIEEITQVPNSELPDYAEMFDLGAHIADRSYVVEDIGYAAILNTLLTRRPDLRKIFAKLASATAETWWTLAPAPFDGFSTIRTGEFDDIPAALNVPPVRYFEVKIEPRDVEWQTSRYSSGGFASMNEVGRQEQLAYLESRRVSASAEDAISKEWPKLVDKMKSLNIVYGQKGYGGGSAWLTVNASPDDIIAAHAFVVRFKDAISPMLEQVKGYSAYHDMLNSLTDTLRIDLPNAESSIKAQSKQADIDEHNRRVYQQAYNIASEWMRANDVDSVTPYFTEQVRKTVKRYGGYEDIESHRGPYYAMLRSPAAVVNDDGEVYPSIGELPIFGEYPHADYFVDATDAILTSPHEHDADAVAWMRKNMKLFANGRTTEVIVMPSAKAYVAKTDDRKSSGFMAMTGAAAHTTLSGTAKAAATRAMAAGKAVAFSFSPRGVDRPTYPDAFVDDICATHLVRDWKGSATKWKLAQ
jgi:hypothetical protein